MARTVKEMIAAANTAVPHIPFAEAAAMIAEGKALVLDVRDAPEVATSGKVAGAHHISRGMLEFRADPDCAYHDPHFRKDQSVILYCASGGRSALAGMVVLRIVPAPVRYGSRSPAPHTCRRAAGDGSKGWRFPRTGQKLDRPRLSHVLNG